MKAKPEVRLMLTATAAAVAMMMINPARAQTTPPPANPVMQSPQTQSPQASGAVTRVMTKDADASHALSMARLTSLKGVDIFDAERKKIGEIEDVLIDPKSGSVHQVVVSTGGVLGIGSKHHGAAMRDVKLYSPAADNLKPVRAAVQGSPDSLPTADKPGRDSPFIAASKYIGTDIVDANGKTIGEIEDVVVDLSTGESRFALVEFDKAWSAVDKLFAFGMQDIQPARENGKLQVNATKESLESRPSIDRKMLDRNELSQLPGAR